MAIDKELFYASHGLKYPVVARQYTDDMQAKEKIYTKDEVVAMLKEIQDEIFKESWSLECIFDDLDGSAVDLDDINNVIQQKINAIEENTDGME